MVIKPTIVSCWMNLGEKVNLKLNNALLNNNVHKVIKALVWYILIVGWKTCNLWLTCYWFNQIVKPLKNVEFKELKSRFWTCFNYKKNGRNKKLIFKLKLLWPTCMVFKKSLIDFNLCPICKHYLCIDHKLNRLFFFHFFFSFNVFFFP